MDRVVVVGDDAGGFRWARRSETGETLAVCDETYPDVDQAAAAARQAHPGLPTRIALSSGVARALLGALADAQPVERPARSRRARLATAAPAATSVEEAEEAAP